MSSEITPDHTAYLQAALTTGKYRDESDALGQALQLLAKRDQLEAKLDAARKQLEAGQGIPAGEAFRRIR